MPIMNIVALQLSCLVTIFSVTTLCGVIPVILVHRRGSAHLGDRASQVLSFCNCLAAGVFLGVCFLGLLPFSRHKFSEAMAALGGSKSGGGLPPDFPLAEMALVLGFFSILALEQGVLGCRTGNTARGVGARSGNTGARVGNAAVAPVVEVDLVRRKGGEDGVDEEKEELLEDEDEEEEVMVATRVGDDDCCAVAVDHPNGTASPANHEAHPSHHSHSQVAAMLTRSSGLQFVLLLMAVSVHSLLEGVALGLQREETRALRLFLAVLLHEALVALAMGVSTSRLGMGVWKGCRYVLAFTTTIPVGGLVGIGLGTTPGATGMLVSGLLQGVAAGVFVYVTLMELVPEEFADGRNRMLKVMFMFVGFMFMTVLNYTLGSQH